MPLPRILHRFWLGTTPTDDDLGNLQDSRFCIGGNTELWLWTSKPIVARLSGVSVMKRNVVFRDIAELWGNPDIEYPLLRDLHLAYLQECHGSLHNYAAASDIARLTILYCYGGIYLDMDVAFQEEAGDIFSDLHDIGPRLGILKYSRHEFGNGVLAAMKGSPAVRICLDQICREYADRSKESDIWSKKREFGSFRLPLTVKMTGPRMLHTSLDPANLLYPIYMGDYFGDIDASAISYNRRPANLRRDSLPLIR